MGQQLLHAMKEMVAVDSKTFQFRFDQPYGMVLETIGKVSSNVPFIMPKRIAETDSFKQIEDYTGSGPFVFVKDKWVHGAKVVYKKFAGYVPRPEQTNSVAGAKIAKVDRVEWITLPDQMTAANALVNGEVDLLASSPIDLMPVLRSSKDVIVEVNDPLGFITFGRFNHLLPPFDKAEVRRAAIIAMKDQSDYMRGGIGDKSFWRTCYSILPCGTPLADESKGRVDREVHARRRADFAQVRRL